MSLAAKIGSFAVFTAILVLGRVYSMYTICLTIGDMLDMRVTLRS